LGREQRFRTVGIAEPNFLRFLLVIVRNAGYPTETLENLARFQEIIIRVFKFIIVQVNFVFQGEVCNGGDWNVEWR